MEPVFKAMNDSFPVVEEYVRNGTRSDGHITGENTFISIADNLVQIFNEMDLDLNRRTRRKSYSDQVVKYYVDSSESDWIKKKLKYSDIVHNHIVFFINVVFIT